MNRFCSRVVVLILVPCFLADSATAYSLFHGSPRTIQCKSHQIFQQQAFAVTVGWILNSFNAIGWKIRGERSRQYPGLSLREGAGTGAVEGRDSETNRLSAIIDHIGQPGGRGMIVPQGPRMQEEQEVDTFEADGHLGKRRIRILSPLGSGLAGKVFLVQDDQGNKFVEKHYGAIPSEDSKSLGRWLARFLFTFFRQAPLSYRELPEAAIASHLSNRFIVAFGLEKYGKLFTPPILYTRYDAQTGGYVHAFPYVDGRPLRPHAEGLPLLGEASIYRRQMIEWRDFLAEDLGFWGLARQVDPANANATSNVVVTKEGPYLQDLVPGVPGFLEWRYIKLGLLRGHFPPFGDAVDFDQVHHAFNNSGLRDSENWTDDLRLLELTVQRWQDSEPRLWSSPGRWRQVFGDTPVRQATRMAAVTHLETTGAITREEAKSYRETGVMFPHFSLHILLKMTPLPVHRALRDRAYAWKLVGHMLRGPYVLLCSILNRIALLIKTILLSSLWLSLAGLHQIRPRPGLRQAQRVLEDRLPAQAIKSLHLATDRTARIQELQAHISHWIEKESSRGRLSKWQEANFDRILLTGGKETSGLFDLLALHSLIELIPVSSTASLLAAWTTGNPIWVVLGMIKPLLRFSASLLYLRRHPNFQGRFLLLLVSGIPSFGISAVPIALLRTEKVLASFMIRMMAQKATLRIPGYGEVGAVSEMLAMAAVQILILDSVQVLPFIAGTGVLGRVLSAQWHYSAWWALVVPCLLYVFTVARAIEPFEKRLLWPLMKIQIQDQPYTHMHRRVTGSMQRLLWETERPEYTTRAYEAGEVWSKGELFEVLERMASVVDRLPLRRLTHPLALLVDPTTIKDVYSLDDIQNIHGLQKSILERLREKEIVVEISPSSNDRNSQPRRQDEGWRFVSLASLLNEGISIICTDGDSGLLNTHIIEEFKHLYFGSTAYGPVSAPNLLRLVRSSFLTPAAARARTGEINKAA